MSGVIGGAEQRTRLLGSPATLGDSLTAPQYWIGNGMEQIDGMCIGMAKGDGMPNAPHIGIKKKYAVTSATTLDPANAGNCYYGGFWVVIGDRGSARFVEVLIGGMSTVSLLHTHVVKNDGSSSLDARTYTCDNQLNLAMASNSYKVATFMYLGYPTAS